MTAEQGHAGPDGDASEDRAEPDGAPPDEAFADEYLADDPLADETSAEEAAGEGVPASNKVLLYLGVLLGGAVLIAMAFLAIELPQCEDPAIVWIPCIGP